MERGHGLRPTGENDGDHSTKLADGSGLTDRLLKEFFVEILRLIGICRSGRVFETRRFCFCSAERRVSQSPDPTYEIRIVTKHLRIELAELYRRELAHKRTLPPAWSWKRPGSVTSPSP